MQSPALGAGDAAIGPGVFHRYAIAQQLMEGAVVWVRDGVPRRSNLRRASSGVLGNGGVEAAYGLAQAAQ